MKSIKLVFQIVINFVFLFTASKLPTKGQTTVQIGTGNDVNVLQQTLYSPLYRFSASSGTTNSRSNILFTQPELADAGITPGAIITSVQFNKVNTARFLTPADYKMYFANSTNTALSSATSWTEILNTHTLVYSNSTFNLDDQPGWITWDITPFTYTGGALEIASDVVMAGNGATTGPFNWEYTLATPSNLIIGATGTSPPATLSGATSAYKHRPNIKIEFIGGASVCLTPSSPTITNITTNSATISWESVSSAQGYEYAITTSNTPPTSGTSTSQTTVNVTGLIAATQYYIYVRTDCGSANFSPWALGNFSTLSPCSPPAMPLFSNISRTADISWESFGANFYEYVLSESSSQPTSGIVTQNRYVQVANLKSTTQYYFHLRAHCGANGYSVWVTKAFTTPCFSPIVVAETDANKISLRWNTINGVSKYEYAITHYPAPPIGGNFTSDTNYVVQGLLSGRPYYFHIRTQCLKGGTSNWEHMEFHLPGLECYPNPVRNILTIRLHDVNNNRGVIMIADAMGRMVKKMELIGNSIDINLRELAAGIYFVKYEDATKKYMIKVLKQ